MKPEIHKIKPGTMAAIMFPGKKFFTVEFAKTTKAKPKKSPKT